MVSIAAVSSVNFRLVRLAREMRGMSQTQLARESGIPQAILSRIEGDVRPADDGEVERLAGALRLPVAFFLEPDAPSAAPLFRKRAIRSATVNRMIQARVNTAVLAARRILDVGIEIEAPFRLPDPSEVPYDDPVEASRALRHAWQLPNGRVDDVTEVVEQAGGIVLRVDFGTDDASAAFVSPLGDARLWFLVNTRETAGDRVRLSLAHELGHAVLHRSLPVVKAAAPEREAYEFAVAFMLPPEDLERAIGRDLTLTRARDLKRAYRISVQAIIRAALDRQLISKARYTSLYKQVSARGWRRDEPDPVPLEQPQVWSSALEVHRDRHGFKDDELASVARVGVDDLADLFPRDFAPRLRLVRDHHSEPPGPARRLGVSGAS